MFAVSSASKDLISALHLLLHVHSAAESPDGMLQTCIPEAYRMFDW